MYCKHCGSPLEEGNTICPSCGQDTAEKEEGILITPGKLALSIGAIVVLVALLAALIVAGLAKNSSEDPTDASGETTVETTEETEPPTIPQDTGLNDATCKGSYTVTDDAMLAAADTVIATLGDTELTNASLQICYWLQVQSFLSSEDFYYLYYYYGAIDYTQPLDTQVCYYDSDLTWQQYFLKSALESWQSYQVMAKEAEAAGFELPQQYRDSLDSMPESLAASAEENGFDSVEAMLERNVGVGATMDDYMAFWEMYYLGYTYYDQVAAEMEPTEDEAWAFFQEHEDVYNENDIYEDSKTVDVRHILLFPEGATSETIRTDTFSDEAWASAKTKAEELLEQWLSGNADEDSFAELANQYSDDGTKDETTGLGTTGGLYTDVAQGDMVDAFDAWCFDEARQVGDYGIVQTEYGYHIMYFCGSEPLWLTYAQNDLLTERANQFLEEATAKYEMTVDYSAIVISDVDMNG